jgi:hypothetical protein
MMNNKGSISKYPAAHTEKQQICPLFCLLAVVGTKFLFFCFCFLIFFLNQGHKNRNSTKDQLKPMKDVNGTNSGAFGKTGAGTSELESSAFWIFFNFFEIAAPSIVGNRMCNFLRAFQKKIHLNWSSKKKVMPVLRRTLRIRFLWRWKLNRMRIGESVDGNFIFVD